MEGKGPLGRRKGSFLKLDRPFEGLKGLFIAKIDRFSYGNDPLGDPLGPPEEEIGPFRDAKDRLGEKIDSFRKIRIISVKKGSIMKENNQMSWGVINFWGRILGCRGVLQYAPTTRVAPPARFTGLAKGLR